MKPDSSVLRRQRFHFECLVIDCLRDWLPLTLPLLILDSSCFKALHSLGAHLFTVDKAVEHCNKNIAHPTEGNDESYSPAG